MKKNIFDYLRKHSLVIAIAIFIGVLVLWPSIHLINTVGNDFMGIYPILNDDEIHYLSKAQEVIDGHSELGSVFIKEYKELPGVRPAFASRMMAAVANFLNLSIPKLGLINDFLLPTVGFLIMYFFFFDISKSRKIALFFSLLYFFIFLNKFGRPINPQFSFIFFTINTWFLWKLVVASQRERLFYIYNIFYGLSFGTLVYLYPFYWSLSFILYCIYFFILAIYEKKYLQYAKGFFIFIVIACLSAIPYILNMGGASSNPFYSEVSDRLGVIYTYWPGSFYSVFLLTLGLAVVFLLNKGFENKKILIFSLCLPLSGIIANWQNIITGKYLQFSSHYFMPIVFYIFLLFVIIFKNTEFKNKRQKSASLLMLVIVLFLLHGQVTSSVLAVNLPDKKNKQFEVSQEYVSLMDWINDNAEADSSFIIYGGDYKWMIPLYTKGNLFISGYASYYLISDNELEDRWIIENIFADNFNKDFVINNHRSFLGNKFIDDYQKGESRRKIFNLIPGVKVEKNKMVPSEYVDYILDKYDRYRDYDFEKLLSLYPVDYILLSKGSENYNKIKLEINNTESIKLVDIVNELEIYKK